MEAFGNGSFALLKRIVQSRPVGTQVVQLDIKTKKLAHASQHS